MSSPTTTKDARLWIYLIAVLSIIGDRVSKLWINTHVPLGSNINVINKVFRISHVLNYGAAFSMFGESAEPGRVRYGLIAFSVIAIVVVAIAIWKIGRDWTPAGIGLGLILGGAIGNLWDRAVLHFVIDFLEVHIGSYHWPDFNIADSCICIGAALLMIEILWPRKTHEESAA